MSKKTGDLFAAQADDFSSHALIQRKDPYTNAVRHTYFVYLQAHFKQHRLASTARSFNFGLRPLVAEFRACLGNHLGMRNVVSFRRALKFGKST